MLTLPYPSHNPKSPCFLSDTVSSRSLCSMMHWLPWIFFWSLVNSTLSKIYTVNAFGRVRGLYSTASAPTLGTWSEGWLPKTSSFEKQLGLLQETQRVVVNWDSALKGLKYRLIPFFPLGPSTKAAVWNCLDYFWRRLFAKLKESAWRAGTCWDSLKDGGAGGRHFLHSFSLLCKGWQGCAVAILSHHPAKPEGMRHPCTLQLLR